MSKSLSESRSPTAIDIFCELPIATDVCVLKAKDPVMPWPLPLTRLNVAAPLTSTLRCNSYAVLPGLIWPNSTSTRPSLSKSAQMTARVSAAGADEIDVVVTSTNPLAVFRKSLFEVKGGVLGPVPVATMASSRPSPS